MRKEISYLKWLEEGIEIDEDDFGDLVLSGVHEEKHVGDAKERQQDQSGLYRFPVTRQMKNVIKEHLQIGSERI